MVVDGDAQGHGDGLTAHGPGTTREEEEGIGGAGGEHGPVAAWPSTSSVRAPVGYVDDVFNPMLLDEAPD